MSSSSRSSSSSNLQRANNKLLISKTSKNLPLSAGVADQLEALEQFRSRDSKIKSMVSGVSKKASAVAERGNQRQLIEQWQTTWQKLRAEVVNKENDYLQNCWAGAEENLFELMNFFSGSSSSSNNNKNRDEGLMFLRRQLKLEGDQLKKCFETCSVMNVSESPVVQTSAAIRNEKMKLQQQRRDRVHHDHDDDDQLQQLLINFVSSLKQDQEKQVQSLEEEYQTLAKELEEISTTKSSASSSSISWFLEPINGAPSLSAISSEWIKSYEPLRKTSPDLFQVFADHQESQQLVLDELAKSASLSRDALLESASSRDLSRLWDLWSSAPKLAPGGKSKRERVLTAAKLEFQQNNNSNSSNKLEDVLDLLLNLRNQKQQLRSKYSSALESVKEQMKRLDDVVVALQTLQVAETSHETFLTQLEQEHSETKEREMKLRSEKEIVEAQRAAEAAIEEEKESKRLEILREKQKQEAEERQIAVSKWLEEKAEKQRQEDEAESEEQKKQQESNRENLEVAKERVKERAKITEAKQIEKQQQEEAERFQKEKDEQRLLEFYAKTDEKVGAQRDPKRLLQTTASTAETAALPSVGESLAKYSRTGHGYSNDKVVKDARFRLAEALSVAGLQNSNYGRSVFNNAFVGKTNHQLAARSMASNFALQ